MKRKIFILLILSIIFLSGCWDMVEINQRLFVSSVGLDLYKKEGMNKYMVSYLYPNIEALGKEPAEETKRFLISTPSSSLFQAGREFSTQVEFPFYYKHLKVFIIGEDMAKEGKLMRQTIDGLNRDTKINKKIQMLVSEGQAKEILKGKPRTSGVTEGIIYNILEDNRSASRFTPHTLTDIIRDTDLCNVTVVPRIVKREKELRISGGAILKNYELIGWIGEKENRALALIKNEVKLELIDAPYKDIIISYNVTEAKSNKKITIDGHINTDLTVSLEGYLQEYIMTEDNTGFSIKAQGDMEKAIEKKVKKEIERTIELLQKEYKADLIGVGEHLSRFQPKEWKRLEDNWENIFPDVKFNVKVIAKIRRTGLTK